VAKLASGGIVIGSLFKSQSGKANESARLLITIAQTEKDVINYDIIKNFLAIYFVEIAIPYFRNNKMKVYLHAMNMFSTEEIQNSNKHLETWNDFLQVIRQTRFN
jgi:hypothetical protein